MLTLCYRVLPCAAMLCGSSAVYCHVPPCYGTHVGATVHAVPCRRKNLGNTCFMNSVVQCLSNTPLLRTFMLSGAVEHEINRDSKLGYHGHMAEAFQRCVNSLWSQEHIYYQPRVLKNAIDRYLSHFGDGMQHDAQEVCCGVWRCCR